MKNQWKYVFSATNPCHVWDQVKGLAALGCSVSFISGYPKGLLVGNTESIDIVESKLPTLITYGVTAITGRTNSLASKLYRWQDLAFDRAVSKKLKSSKGIGHVFIGIPGQCAASFQIAQKQGMVTVLNHASGPIEIQNELVNREKERLKIPVNDESEGVHSISRLDRERDLADIHLVASTTVRDQFVSLGIDPGQIIVAPYGVDETVFFKNEEMGPVERSKFRIMYAGQMDVRKGIHYVMDIWKRKDLPTHWELEVYGPDSSWLSSQLKDVECRDQIQINGAVPQRILASAMRSSDVLVVPSVEDAFGLVVPQALQCGTPCVVSSRVGAKDLINKKSNGAVFEYGNEGALFDTLLEVDKQRPRVTGTFDSISAARVLESALSDTLNRRAE
ncbi:MAG: glycosyltransferase family 4 protein [Opitutales bacterium]